MFKTGPFEMYIIRLDRPFFPEGSFEISACKVFLIAENGGRPKPVRTHRSTAIWKYLEAHDNTMTTAKTDTFMVISRICTSQTAQFAFPR
jgi:hypothetical protein